MALFTHQTLKNQLGTTVYLELSMWSNWHNSHARLYRASQKSNPIKTFAYFSAYNHPAQM